MILVNCPNCGPRNVQEFRYGGEYNSRPKVPSQTPDTDWSDYLFMRSNKLGVQTEWWYHRAGCGKWFLTDRHTKSNEVLKGYLWEPGMTPWQKRD